MLSSSDVLLSLLREEDYELKEMAIKKLSFLSDTYWYEMMEVLPELESLVDSADFPLQREAALVCSKVYYHLQSFEDAVNFALKAGDLFDVEEQSLYADTVAGQCIELYAAVSKKGTNCEGLKGIILRAFCRCLKDEQYDQALGIALECRDVTMLQQVLSARTNQEDYLPHVFHVLRCFPVDTSFLTSALELVLGRALELPSVDYFFVFRVLISLSDYDRIALYLQQLLQEDRPLALQLAFDVQDGLQMLSRCVIDRLREEDSDLISILDGTVPTRLHLKFLISNSRDESQTLLNFAYTRSCDPTCSTAVVIANAFINYGSTCDYLFRHVHDFMSKFTNWSRFIATGSLGLIHKGNESNAMTVLDNYLPKDTVHSSRYAVGGGLFALGLIHLGRGGSPVDYLLQHFTNDQSDVVRHGAALGIGMAAFASNNEQLVESLLAPVHSDALVGEAAAISVGLVLFGTQNEFLINTLLSIADVNEHEKTLRGIATALPLLMFGRGDAALGHIDGLIHHQSPIHRWSGMYVVGLAYCGTGSDWAVSQLLHFCVTDANDDVRRAAAISIGLVLYRFPQVCLKVVRSLLDSFNPHVRYGSVMALGIAFASSGDKAACQLIEPLWDDNCSFVRQGAAIASGMILMQQTRGNPDFQQFTKFTTVTVQDKHESAVSKFGALLGLGVAYAGSGNVSIRLDNDDGHPNIRAIVGVFLFQQFWFWFPMSFMLSMAFSPTSAVYVDQEFRLPEVKMCYIGPELDIVPLVVEKKTRHKTHSSKSANFTSRIKRKKTGQKDPPKKGEVELPPPVPPTTSQHYILVNPSRVFVKQRPLVDFESSRFRLVKEITSGGSIFVLRVIDPAVQVNYVNVPSSIFDQPDSDKPQE